LVHFGFDEFTDEDFIHDLKNEIEGIVHHATHMDFDWDGMDCSRLFKKDYREEVIWNLMQTILTKTGKRCLHSVYSCISHEPHFTAKITDQFYCSNQIYSTISKLITNKNLQIHLSNKQFPPCTIHFEIQSIKLCPLFRDVH